jgi:hypothetical protein
MKKYMRTITASLIAAGVALSLVACDDQAQQPTANQQEHAQQMAQQAEGQAAVGPVNILNWTQKRQFKAILEAFDQPNLVTYSYLFSNYTGKVVPLCRSQGYGFNEATEYTNPLQADWKTMGGEGIGVAVTGQQDPNGLYSPPTSAGTLLMCLTTDKRVMPVRSEPDVLTLPVPYDQLDRAGM